MAPVEEEKRQGDKLEINVSEWDGWISATVEDFTGNLLGSVTAPVVEGATFDIRAAVIRTAVEEALHPAPTTTEET